MMRPSRYTFLFWFLVLISCTATPLPYPPSIDIEKMELRVSDPPGSLILTGRSGALDRTGVQLRFLNAVRPSDVDLVSVDSDGAFEASVPADPTDTVRIDVLDGRWRTIGHLATEGGGVVMRVPVPYDGDSDGFARTVDCSDSEPLTFPGAAELCDGVDNDCDGDIDEDSACGCATDLHCDDGVFCNGTESCQPEGCVAGEVPSCDDEDPDTVDRCEPLLGACGNFNSQPICGNGLTEAGEQCDDGNLEPGDGCSERCQLVPVLPNCGNCEPDIGEECDDCNVIFGDGCELDCTFTPGCMPEICNSIDDDCDGDIDENFDFASDPENCGGCGMMCAVGQTCQDSVCVAE